jgi:hypothetical protein
VKLHFLCKLLEESDEKIAQHLTLCLGQEDVMSSYVGNDFGLEKEQRGDDYIRWERNKRS